MPNRIRPLLEITGVEPGRTGVVKVPVDPRYWAIVLAISANGQVLNQIVQEFRLKIGTKVQRVITPDQLDHIYKLYGSNGDTSYALQNNVAGETITVPIHLAEPWRRDYVSERAFALTTGGSQPIVVEVVFKGTADASLEMTARAEYDNPVYGANDARPDGFLAGDPIAMGPFTKMYGTDIPINGTQKTWPDLEKVDDLQQISLFDSDIASIEFIVGDETIREVTKEEADADLVRMGMTPSDSVFDIVFDDRDNPFGSLPLTDGNGRPRKNVYLKLNLSDGTPRNIATLIQKFGFRD